MKTGKIDKLICLKDILPTLPKNERSFIFTLFSYSNSQKKEVF
jgi:hypothetical protein